MAAIITSDGDNFKSYGELEFPGTGSERVADAEICIHRRTARCATYYYSLLRYRVRVLAAAAASGEKTAGRASAIANRGPDLHFRADSRNRRVLLVSSAREEGRVFSADR